MAVLMILVLIAAIAAYTWKFGADSRDGNDWFHHDRLAGPRTAPGA